ncbi:MAG: hypothetical protein H7338_07260 [Candidatus Sericytochromatia bacterium]|nr:hypothetical protein [Candidatus Sericytochromatia bacterium]
MGSERQKTQLELAFMAEMRGEAPRDALPGTEMPAAMDAPESPAAKQRFMEAVCSRRGTDRVLEGVKRFLCVRLKLRVNEATSALDRPQRRKFPGFTFLWGAEAKQRERRLC